MVEEIEKTCWFINGHNENWEEIDVTIKERSDAYLSLKMKLIDSGYNTHRTGDGFFYDRNFDKWCEVEVFYGNGSTFLMIVTRVFDKNKKEFWTADKVCSINVDCLVLNGKEKTV